IDGIKRANSAEPGKIRDALAATKEYPAVTGKISLNENHDAVKSAVILEMKDGKQTFNSIVNP
ncbi:MAG: livK 2, partial [Anaerospora sp.]|nr:livK 2 [Anaerospora sp.]